MIYKKMQVEDGCTFRVFRSLNQDSFFCVHVIFNLDINTFVSYYIYY